jgi:predicted molibdopterin-dependent oxidoreductase YjgC
MTMHFPDDIDVNVLTIDATDPKSGTAEFKATAVRVEKRNGRPREAAGVANKEADG